MKDEPVILDERAVAVLDRSGRIAYLILMVGVMIDGAVRHWAFGQSCWDLYGLVLLSGGVAIVYRWAKRVRLFPRRMIMTMLIAMALGLAITFAAIALLKR